MPWWATLIFLSLMTYLWLSGRSNPDDVIGLLEQMLAVALALVVLFIGHNLLLETLVLLFALRLPTARRGIPVIDRPQASKDVLIPF
jgi:multisubunit Na+/H+ antiporter MnhF subunit